MGTRVARLAVGMCTLWLASTAGLAQAPVSRPAPVPPREANPVFRAGVDLVTVDATVVGAAGQPLASLAAADFQLTVDGRPRRIVSAQFVAQEATTGGPRLVAPEHFSTNETRDEGRLVVVAVDEAHIRRLEGGAALKAAGAFIDRLDARDRVAVTGLARTSVIEFTRDRVVLNSRLAGLVGQGDPAFLQFNIGLSEAIEVADGSRTRLAEVVQRECGRALTEYLNPARAADDVAPRDACPEQVEQEARAASQYARTQARISLSALEGLVSSLKDIEGPKTVVLLSEGLVAEPRYIDFAELAAAAQAARVSIYVLHMEAPLFEAAQTRVSPSLIRDVQVRGDGLARLAGSSRGAVFRLVGSDPQPFDRIRRELSGYYLLAFEPEPADRDGRLHRIDVRLARGGGNLRAREAFRLPAPLSPARAREVELVTLLRQTHPAREVPVRVATYTYAEPASSDLRVVVSTEADSDAGSADDVLLGYVLIDAAGVIVSSAAHRAHAGRHAFSAVLPPGQYTLRAAGIDPLGRRGLVVRPFAAAVRSHDGVRVSDVIVAPRPASAAQPLEPIVDTVRATALVVNVELYADDAAPLDAAALQFEIVSTALIGSVRLARPADVTRRDARWAIARAVFPVDTLRPGSYVARVQLAVAGGPPTVVERPFTLQ